MRRTRIGPIHDFRRARAAYGDGMYAFTQPVNTNLSYGDGMYAFTQPVNTNLSYGDGMFSFTQPVNTNLSYADGGLFFTQQVGVGNVGPAPIRMSNFQHVGYGATPAVGKMSLRGQSVAQAATSDARKGGGRGGATETKRKAATADASVVARFEDAADKYGETTFWHNFWNRPSALAGSNFSSTSATLKAADDKKFSDAKAALNAARVELLRGVPAFATNATGLPTDAAGRAFMAYEQGAVNKGYYKAAFRNAENLDKRKPSKTVYDAIARDALDPYKKSKASLDLARNIARAYILADMESSWDADNKEWGAPKPKSNTRSRTDAAGTYNFSASLSDGYWFFPSAAAKQAWVDWDKADKANEAVRAAAMTGDFKNQLKADRAVQEAAKASLPSRFSTAKSAWEAERKAFVAATVEGQRATLQQEQAGRNAEARAVAAENLVAGVRVAADLALSKRTGAENAALVGDVALATASSTEATAAANAAQNSATRINTLANEASAFASASAGTGTAANERAKAAREDADQLASDARANAEAAFGQIAAAQAKGDAIRAESAANAAQVAVTDAQARLARGEITQAEYDAIVAKADALKAEADRLVQVSDSVSAAVTPKSALTVADDSAASAGAGFFAKHKTELAIAAAVGGVGLALWLRSRVK
jgi:hypothetical protein